MNLSSFFLLRSSLAPLFFLVLLFCSSSSSSFVEASAFLPSTGGVRTYKYDQSCRFRGRRDVFAPLNLHPDQGKQLEEAVEESRRREARATENGEGGAASSSSSTDPGGYAGSAAGPRLPTGPVAWCRRMLSQRRATSSSSELDGTRQR